MHNELETESEPMPPPGSPISAISTSVEGIAGWKVKGLNGKLDEGIEKPVGIGNKG